MKFATKVKLILPMLVLAQTASAAELPRRSPNDILLVACSKGVETCKNCTLQMTIDSKIIDLHKVINCDFNNAKNISPEVLATLTPAEKEIAIIGFVTLLMLPQTGISLKGAVDAAVNFASMPNSPEYFNKFVDIAKRLRNAGPRDANKVLDTLKAAENCLPASLIENLKAIELKYGFADHNDKLRAIKSLLRNNKNYE